MKCLDFTYPNNHLYFINNFSNPYRESPIIFAIQFLRSDNQSGVNVRVCSVSIKAFRLRELKSNTLIYNKLLLNLPIFPQKFIGKIYIGVTPREIWNNISFFLSVNSNKNTFLIYRNRCIIKTTAILLSFYLGWSTLFNCTSQFSV